MTNTSGLAKISEIDDEERVDVTHAKVIKRWEIGYLYFSRYLAKKDASPYST